MRALDWMLERPLALVGVGALVLLAALYMAGLSMSLREETMVFDRVVSSRFEGRFHEVFGIDLSRTYRSAVLFVENTGGGSIVVGLDGSILMVPPGDSGSVEVKRLTSRIVLRPLSEEGEWAVRLRAELVAVERPPAWMPLASLALFLLGAVLTGLGVLMHWSIRLVGRGQ